MSNRILYLGEKNVFFATINLILQKKNYLLYQFDRWDDCRDQLGDLDVFFIFIDEDTFDCNLIELKASDIPFAIFLSRDNSHLESEADFTNINKPLDVNEFTNNIDNILKG